MRRFCCSVVLAADYIHEGKFIMAAGAEVWRTYRVATAPDAELAASVLSHPPESIARSLERCSLKVEFHEFPEETASTPAKFLAMPRQEITRAGELEDAARTFMKGMTGDSWYGDEMDFDDDSPLQVFDRYRGHPNYFVDVTTLEWHAMPFVLFVSIGDDRKYHRLQMIVLDPVLAHRAVAHILEARARALARETSLQIQEPRMEPWNPEELVVLSAVGPHTPMILFDAHHLVCEGGTIRVKE